MDWLRSEDLKEEKVVTTPVVIIAAQTEVVIQIDLWATRTHEIMSYE